MTKINNSSNVKKTKAVKKIKSNSVSYTESSYTVIRKDDVKIYNPNAVTTRKRIISA